MSFRLPPSLRLALACAVLLSLTSVARAGRCPNALFVVDKSSSMLANPSGGGTPPSKWQLARTAINQTLSKYRSRIPFGLEMFGHDSNSSSQQCYPQTMIQVLPSHTAWPQIQALLNASNPDSHTDTNSGEAIKRAIADGMLNAKDRGNFIVLITDGDPNCNPGDNTLPTYTLSQITAAANQDPPVHTFVIGFDASGGVNPDNLNAMAIAGKEPKAGCNPNVAGLPCYYSASNSVAFSMAIQAITQGLVGGSVIGGCDDSCFALGCPPDDNNNPQVCHFAMPGADPTCVLDECAQFSCGDGKYCSVAGGHAACYTPCPSCAAGTYCLPDGTGAGQCVQDKCFGQTVGANQTCDPATGVFGNNKCSDSIDCARPQFCNPVTGYCDEDPCRTINCPAGSTCNGGWCEAEALGDEGDMTVPDDMSIGGRDFSGAGGGTSGCSTGGGSPLAGSLPLVLALALLLQRRRRT